MRRLHAATPAVVALALGFGPLAIRPARAAEPNLPRLVLDSGRPAFPAADPDAYRFVIHGEEQLRFQVQSELPLVPTPSTLARSPGLASDPLGQEHFLQHWLRLSPRLQLRDTLELVGQLDVVTGLIAGDRARETRADLTPRDSYDGFENVQPRWLYADWRIPVGRVRIGQQPNHWGMGLLANDGDHPLPFGDYRYGAINERLLFLTGKDDSPFHFALAGDLVFRDNFARLTRSEQAYQGVAAAYFARGENRIGFYSAFRHQENQRGGRDQVVYFDALDLVSLDLHARMAKALPSDANAFLFAEAEAAYVAGAASFVRAAGFEASKTPIRSFGGAAKIGVVHRSTADDGEFGDLVGQVELGYASGDSDPYDGTYRRFVFDPNHRVGLLLFDEVLRFQTARAATAANDPSLPARLGTGIDLMPSNGGVFGAQYINPTALYRPRHWLDLKAGAVIAQATTNVTDPYRFETAGARVNHRGGEVMKRDLGVELDAGVEARVPLAYDMKLQLGAQGGVLFPGGALEDATGTRLATPWLAVGRAGILF